MPFDRMPQCQQGIAGFDGALDRNQSLEDVLRVLEQVLIRELLRQVRDGTADIGVDQLEQGLGLGGNRRSLTDHSG